MDIFELLKNVGIGSLVAVVINWTIRSMMEYDSTTTTVASLRPSARDSVSASYGDETVEAVERAETETLDGIECLYCGVVMDHWGICDQCGAPLNKQTKKPKYVSPPISPTALGEIIK